MNSWKKRERRKPLTSEAKKRERLARYGFLASLRSLHRLLERPSKKRPTAI